MMPDFTLASQWTVFPTPNYSCNQSGCTVNSWNYNINNNTGWSTLQPMYGAPRILVREGGWPCNSNEPVSQNYSGNTLSRVTFIGTDGTEMDLVDQKSGGEPQPYAFGSGSPGYDRGSVWVTRDGTSAVFTTSGSDIVDVVANAANCSQPPTGVSGTLVMRDGTTYQFSSGYVTHIIDRNGNTLTFLYENGSNYLTSITDAEGRQYGVLLNQTDSASGRQYDQLSYPGFGGTTRYIKIFYDVLANVLRSDQTIKNDNQLWPGVLGVNQIPSQVGGAFISEILLPDGTSYNFQRDSYGNVAEVILPTGGMIQYDWAGQVGSVGGSQVTVAPASFSLRCYLTQRREYSNGSTLSRVTKYSSPGGSVTVTDYDGNDNLQSKVSHTLATPPWPPNLRAIDYDITTAGQEPTTQYYDTNGSTLLRTISRTYQERSCTGDSTCWWVNNSNSNYDTRPPHDFLPWQETTTEGSFTKQTVSLYDQYNNENNKTESDWGSAPSPGSVLRQTLTTFNTGSSYIAANILNLPVESQTYSTSGGTLLADTKYSYDESTATPDTGISGNTAPPAGTPRGNLTTTRRCISTTAGCSWTSNTSTLPTTYTYDVAGNVTSITDPRQNVTHYSYADPQNTYAHVTTITDALNQTREWAYDYSTGHPVLATDPNSVNDVYKYADPSSGALDPLDRVRVISNADSTYAGDLTNVTYPSTTEVDLYQDQNSLNDKFLRTQHLYDGFGRLLESRTYTGASTYRSEPRTYDSLGRVLTITNELGGVTQYGYDGLGRNT
jgi:YD repeat-containing protein